MVSIIKMMISLAEARLRIPDKKHLYSSLVRNSYLMPPKKDAILTAKFMRGVWFKKYWVLCSSEVVTVRMCADPPNRKVLAKIVHDIMKSYRSLGEPIDSGMRRTARLIKKTPPSSEWLLLVLSNLDGEHELFSKGYIAPRKPKKAESECMIDNHGDFFQGLPIVDQSKNSKRFMSLMSEK